MDNSIIFRHESFQLWEGEVQGTLLNKNNDFVTLNREGINVFALGNIPKRPITDNEGNLRMIHSLEAFNYLKLAKTNSLVFANQNQEKREI